MMGRRMMAEPLFYTFRLEDHVPSDHPLRAVDMLLDTAFIRRVMAPHYSAIGRPSIDPELMIRMLLVGYLNGVRSERKLCAEVHLNLGYRWFCRLGLDGAVPDHSTFEPRTATAAFAMPVCSVPCSRRSCAAVPRPAWCRATRPPPMAARSTPAPAVTSACLDAARQRHG